MAKGTNDDVVCLNTGGFVGSRAARPQVFEVQIFHLDLDFRLLSLSKQKNKKKLFDFHYDAICRSGLL